MNTLRDRLNHVAMAARETGLVTMASFRNDPDAHPETAALVDQAYRTWVDARPRISATWLFVLVNELMDGNSPDALSFATDAIKRTGVAAGPVWATKLANVFATELEVFFSGLAGPDGDGMDAVMANAMVADDGMWWLSARLADYIEQLGHRAVQSGRDGTRWTDTAQDIRDRNRARWAARDTAKDGPWDWWIGGEHTSRALQALAIEVWHLELMDEHHRVSSAVQARPNIVVVDEDQYVKIGKGLMPASWALGAPGVEVEVDGDLYTATSGVVRYVSRAMGVRPDKDGRPSGVQLPLDLQTDMVPVTVAAVRDTQFVINPRAAKQLLFMFATGRRNGLVELSVEDMTRQVNPELKRYQKRDHEQTTVDALSLSRTRLVFPDGYNAQILEIHHAPGDGMGALQWGFTRGFTKRLETQTKLLGEFVLNLSGAMRLTARQSPELRAYVFAAGQWNDAKRPGTGTDTFDAHYLPAYTIEQWGAQTNTLSEAAVEYLQEGGKDKRRRLSASKADVRRWLEALQDEHGLVRIEKQGKQGKRFKVLPPDALLEAYRLHRSGARRPFNE
jgi:hypothetical protein